jgi:hypothetical protein
MAHYRNIHRLIACSAVQKSPWPPRVFKDLALFLCRENAFLSKWSPDSVFHWNNSSCLLAPAAPTRLCQSDSKACRVSLEIRKLSSSSINVRLSAVRKPALEAAQNGLLDYAVAAGILGVKGVKKLGVRIGQWLSLQQAQTLAFQNRHLLTQCWNLQSQIGLTVKKTHKAVAKSRMNRSMNLPLYHTAKMLIPGRGGLLATDRIV